MAGTFTGIPGDAMESAAFGATGPAAGEFDYSAVGEHDALMDSPDFPAARVDEIGNRTAVNREGAQPPARGTQPAQPAQTPDYGKVIEERFSALQQQFNQREQALVQVLQDIAGKVSGQPPAPAAKVEDQGPVFQGIEDMMPPEDWAALHPDMRSAYRALDATNRQNFMALHSTIQKGQSPELVKALEEVTALRKEFNAQQEQAKYQRIQQEAAAAKAKFDPENKGVLAPYQQKLAYAVGQLGMSVEEAIRAYAPQVYERAVVMAALKRETPRIQNDALAGLFGGGPNADPTRSLGYEDDEDVATSISKVMQKIGANGRFRG